RESTGGMLILTLMDISERLRGEAEREALLNSERAARAEAERSNRLKEEFLATLSHELRTPLSAILGWSAVISRTEGLPATVTQGVHAIERNSRLQAQMINDLLDYAGITYGKLRLAMAVIDPCQAIRAAVDVVQGSAQSAGVQLSASLPADGVHVEADPSRLQQMVWNLLTNAIKFSPPGATVALRAEVADGHLRVVVRDQGQGIAPHFLPRIFERFSQQDATSKRRHGGLGLGLAIVRQMAELHGGSVTAFSEGEGRGATFTLELPLVQEYAPSTQLSDTQLRRSLDLSGVVVLLVEDDVDARALARRVLGDAGAQIIEAASVRAALQALETSQVHVLVSDIGMAGEDGYELIRQVRGLGYGPERLPAIALTAFAREQDRDDALAAGFQDHVVKPFDAQALILSVAAVRQSAPAPVS
ncbi:MAG TPA: ATP-binding protein, partial [Steroidobacteraceae bacterium]|nr:ATP-binding protein [Steroidobacteraceae bacterium]